MAQLDREKTHGMIKGQIFQAIRMKVIRIWNRSRLSRKIVWSMTLILISFFCLRTFKFEGIRLSGNRASAKLSPSEIIYRFGRSMGLEQNHSKFIDFIRDNHLFPPSEKPYNLAGLKALKADDHEKEWRFRKGIFIEAGAGDGETNSYTLGLEGKYEWTGLLIEADPISVNKLFDKHRKAWIVDTCVGNKDYPYETVMQRHKEFAGISNIIGSQNEPNPSFEKFQVKCLPLFSIISSYGKFDIDYFRLSVEHTETDVLRTIPFDSVFFKVISIEVDFKYRRNVIPFLEEKGYVCIQHAQPRIANNFLFIHKSLYQEGMKDETAATCHNYF